MTLIVAHRGASGYEPEMTQEAYNLAIEMGVDGVEVDVRLTKDDLLVAIHDRNTKRVADKNINVSKSSFQDLLNLNFLGEEKKSGMFKILKLSDLIDFLLEQKRPLLLAIESKHPSLKSFKLEKSIAKTLQNYDLKDGKIENLKIILMSFNIFAVRAFKKLLPEIPAVMLVEKNYPFLSWFPTPARAEYVGPGINLLNKNPKLYERWRMKGKKFYVWTVDHPKDIEWCIKKQVEIFASNYPDISLRHKKTIDFFG